MARQQDRPFTRTELKILVFNKVKNGMDYKKAVAEVQKQVEFCRKTHEKVKKKEKSLKNKAKRMENKPLLLKLPK